MLRTKKPINYTFDRMVAELSPYMTDGEIIRAISVADLLGTSEFDRNLSTTDLRTQMILLVGSERYSELTARWGADNQPLLSVFGTRKYRHTATGEIYDGLDSTDVASDYEVFYQ